MRTPALALALAAHLAAQEPPGSVTTIAGETFAATVAAIAGGEVRLTSADGSTRSVPLDEIEAIEIGGRARRTAAGPGCVWLRSGAALGARAVGGDAGGVELDVGFGPVRRFALVHMRALRFESADAAGDDDRFSAAIDAPTDTEDLLFAWNRRTGKLSRLSVRVLGLDGDALKVVFRDDEQSVPLDQVHGIVFGRDNGIDPPAPPLPNVTVATTDGVRLRGSLTDCSGNTIELELAEGPRLALPREFIDRIEVRSSRVLRLSQVAPEEVLQVPAFDQLRPWLVDRAPGGGGLVLADRTFPRGLCLIPRTRLTWSLEPHAFDVFEATIGIDDRSTGPADAVFRVLLDGAVAFERQHVGAGFVETIRVPLDAAASLSLEVDFGDRLDLGDHCVFAEARLLKL